MIHDNYKISEDQNHLDSASDILYMLEFFDRPPRGEEGNTIMQFNKFNVQRFSESEQKFISHMLHIFNRIAGEALATAGKTNDHLEIEKWHTFLYHCQDAETGEV